MTSETNGSSAATAATSIDMRPRAVERGESLLVTVAIVQGLLLGVWLGGFPVSALRMGGFPTAPAFFVRWAGVLHVVLAVGYALEWIRARRTTLLVVAKAATALFLGVAWITGGLPWLMILAVVLEAALATAGALLHGPATRSRLANARLHLVTPAPTAMRPTGRS